MALRTPSRTVTTGTAAGAAAVVIVWVLGMFAVDVPGEVQAAFAVIVTVLAAWVQPDPARRPPADDDQPKH